MLLVTSSKAYIISFLVGALLSVAFVMPLSVSASSHECNPSNPRQADSPRCQTNVECGEGHIKTSFKWGGRNCVPINETSPSTTNNPIYGLLIDFLKFFSALVGLAVTGGIIYGGILWSTAQGNPGQVGKATTVITNSIIGLIMYILMFAIINFLVPGGLFK